MVKKNFAQITITKKIILKIFFSLVVAFLITLISENLQKKKYVDVKLVYEIDRNVKMELALLNNTYYRTNLNSILLTDNLKIQELLTEDEKIFNLCSFAKINNEIFMSLNISEAKAKLNFVSNENLDLNLCKIEIGKLLNSMMSFYFKNLIKHKEKSIIITTDMQEGFELSGSLATHIIELETLKRILENRKKFFTTQQEILDKSDVNSRKIFVSVFLTILFLLNLSLISKKFKT